MKMRRFLSFLIAVVQITILILPISAPVSAWWTEGGVSPDADTTAVCLSGACGDNLTYELRESGNLFISGTGAMYDYTSSGGPWRSYAYDNAMYVYFDSGITYIGQYAFTYCYALQQVTFPDTLVEIGDYAFYSAAELGDVVLPEGLTTIGNSAFSLCGYPGLDGYNFTSVTLPSSIKTIGNQAFSMCGRLSKINLPEGLETIGTSAFASCFYLTELEMPDSVTSIGESIFNSCNRLKNLRLSDNLEVLPKNMFSAVDPNMTSMSEITLPKKMKRIEKNALNGRDLETIYIPGNVETIAANAFSGFDGTIYFSGNAPTFDAETFINDVTIYYPPGDSTWDNVVGQNFGSAITWIESEHNWGEWQRISAPTCIKEGEQYRICLHCGAEETSSIPALGHSYENDICTVCGAEKPPYTYEISDGQVTITDYTGAGGDVEIPATIDGYPVTSIGGSAFRDCKSLTGVTIPDSVMSIGDYAFRKCTRLTSVNIPDSVTSIGKETFAGCSSLTSVEIPDSVTSIGDSAFASCSSLTSVEIPDSVASISKGMFYNCTGLTSINIPDSVTSIGYSTFEKCTSLTSVTYCGTEEQWNAISIGDYNDPLLNAERQYHAYQDAACTVPKTCSICGATAGEPAGHSYESVVTVPTCTEQGYTTHVCTGCGDCYVDTYVGTIGHTWSDWVQTVAPTCTAEGSQLRFCNCGAQETEPVAKLPHSYESVVTAPTCTAQGYTTHTCGVCGDSYVDSYVDATEHVYEDGVCTGCGHTKCVAHAWEDGACTACGQQLIEAIDLDSDGKITAFDAQVLAEAKAGLRQLTDAQWQALGDLQVADIKNYILGKLHP